MARLHFFLFSALFYVLSPFHANNLFPRFDRTRFWFIRFSADFPNHQLSLYLQSINQIQVKSIRWAMTVSRPNSFTIPMRLNGVRKAPAFIDWGKSGENFPTWTSLERPREPFLRESSCCYQLLSYRSNASTRMEIFWQFILFHKRIFSCWRNISMALWKIKTKVATHREYLESFELNL